MMRKITAVRSTLGWLLLAACVVLAVCAVAGEMAPAPKLHYDSSGRTVAVEAIPVQTGTVKVNSADADELDSLPGVGESIALAILEERLLNGPFFYPEDMMHVRGIGEKKLEEMRDLLDLTEGAP